MTPQPSLESERKTRKQRIDPRLKQWGWDITPFNPSKPLSGYRHHAIEEFPTANGPADYALVVDGKLLGIVEAKKVTLSGLKTFSPRPSGIRRVWNLPDSTSTAIECRFSIRPTGKCSGSKTFATN